MHTLGKLILKCLKGKVTLGKLSVTWRMEPEMWVEEGTREAQSLGAFISMCRLRKGIDK